MPGRDEDLISDRCYAELLSLIYKQTGITIRDNRKTMLVGRLRKRLHEQNIESFNAYLDLIQRDGAELQQFVDRLTTNKTYFHRTPRIWHYLTDTFIPQWIESGNMRPISVWSAAASTGEEAHTAGVILEDFRTRHPGFDYKILGTDVSSQVIKFAEAGSYGERAVQRFRQDKPELFQKYMIGNDEEGYRAAPDIRRRIRFKKHNLFKPLTPALSFDIILLRNVLIYFTKPDQEKVLSTIEQNLHAGATLIIGESETLSPLNTNFASTAPLVYHREVAKAGRAA